MTLVVLTIQLQVGLGYFMARVEVRYRQHAVQGSRYVPLLLVRDGEEVVNKCGLFTRAPSII